MPEDLLHFSRENIRDYKPEDWPMWRKRQLTRATRVLGPFEVEEREGNKVLCSDGYIAVDRAGFPYPIAREEFEETYECVSQAQPDSCLEVHSEFLVACIREYGHPGKHRYITRDMSKFEWGAA